MQTILEEAQSTCQHIWQFHKTQWRYLRQHLYQGSKEVCTLCNKSRWVYIEYED